MVVSKMKKKAPQGNQIFVFMLRYTVPKELVYPVFLERLVDVGQKYRMEPTDAVYALGLQPGLHSFLESIFDKFVYQLEDSHLEKTKEELLEKWEKGIWHNLHFQIYGHVAVKKRVSQLIKLFNDSKWKGTEIRPCSANGVQALKKYCMKKDTRVHGPWADHKIYMGEDLLNLSDFVRQQRLVHDYIQNTEPGKRCSLWIFDALGGGGKSALIKYMSYHYGYPAFSYASAKDILYLVAQFKNKRCYMINLSKSKPAELSNSELYAALEGIKDGMFTSTKYVPENILQGPTHLVVMANCLPDTEKMTRKRFKVLRFKPLPAHMIADNDEFDWGDLEVMSPEQIQKERAEQIVKDEILSAKRDILIERAKVRAQLELNPNGAGPPRKKQRVQKLEDDFNW